MEVNLIYPPSAEEPAIAGIGCTETATYVISFESSIVNMGGPLDDGKESGSRESENGSENLRCIRRESAWP
jgi:hypothetical protein